MHLSSEVRESSQQLGTCLLLNDDSVHNLVDVEGGCLYCKMI